MCYPLGEVAQVVDFGGPVSDLKRQTILSLMQHLQAQPFSGFTECVPAYTTLTVYYQATEIAGRDVRADLLTRLHSLTQLTRTSTTRVDIPVCYEQPCAPDLLDVADHCQMTPADVIGLHVKTEHQVLFLGFAPGLPYLRSPSSTLNLPRRTTPDSQFRQDQWPSPTDTRSSIHSRRPPAGTSSDELP